MRLESIRIQNYRSFSDSGFLKFSPGFNIVVGANNVGKTSLLFCLAGKFGGEPHKSIRTLLTRDEPLNQTSRADFTLVASGDELRRAVLNAGDSNRYFPWPSDTAVDRQSAGRVLSRILDAEAIRFSTAAYSNQGQPSPQWMTPGYPSMHLFDVANSQNSACPMLEVTINRAAKGVVAVNVGPVVAKSNDFSQHVARALMAKVYRFSAERLSLGAGSYGTTADLAPDAQNLAEVLNILQGNHVRFQEYCDLVREIFPTIQAVSVRPHPSGGGRAEVLVWQIDPALQRDDLAMPLLHCGTGVGQVLAILYVAKTSEQPRTIIIDEPGSFLHPGAARALIGILKRFGKHQYIVATHSPEIISELSDASLTIVRWHESESKVEQFPRTASDAASAALNEVGAKLSDVFGFDKVLWVEGQSDASALKAVLESIGRPQRRTAILPVRDTGSFRRKMIPEVMYLYRALSMGDALLPPAVLFLFDREGRTDKEIGDAIRESRGMIRFLKRRMLENYLLNPEAIARLFNEAGADHGLKTTPADVEGWLGRNGVRHCKAQPEAEVFSAGWLEFVDAATLLEELFQEFSGAKLEYRKTTHTPRLAVLLTAVDFHAASEIAGLVSDVIE